MAERTTTGRRAVAGGRGGCLVALLFFCVLGAAVVCWGRPAAAAEQQSPDIRLNEFYDEVLSKEHDDGRERKDLTAIEQNAFAKFKKSKASLERAAMATGMVGGAGLSLGLLAAFFKDLQVTHRTNALLSRDEDAQREKEKKAKRASMAFKGALGMSAIALAAAVALGFVTRAAVNKVRKVRQDYRAIRDNLATEVSSRAAQQEESVDSGADGGEELAEEEAGEQQ